MDSKPDPKHLPAEKKEALANKVADDMHRQVTRTLKELTDHEVSKEDAYEVIGTGIVKGVERVNEELEKGKN